MRLKDVHYSRPFATVFRVCVLWTTSFALALAFLCCRVAVFWRRLGSAGVCVLFSLDIG